MLSLSRDKIDLLTIIVTPVAATDLAPAPPAAATDLAPAPPAAANAIATAPAAADDPVPASAIASGLVLFIIMIKLLSFIDDYKPLLYTIISASLAYIAFSPTILYIYINRLVIS